MGRRLDLALGVLNGALGHHLFATNNPLATPMAFVERTDRTSAHVVVLVHGLMSTERVWAFPDGSDYGTALADALGMTALRVRYNSGRAIADSGAALSSLLDELVRDHPHIESLTLVGHSMGGLVIRSACHADSTWLPRVRRAIYVGTPHRGAPLERLGKVVHGVLRAVDDPYTRTVADVADLRSTGMKDLGAAHPRALSSRILHHVVAGTLTDARGIGAMLGDALVPLASATDDVTDRLIVRAGHNTLARHAVVRDRIVAWCTP